MIELMLLFSMIKQAKSNIILFIFIAFGALVVEMIFFMWVNL